MSTEAPRNHVFAIPHRLLFGLIAVATFIAGSPWDQPSQLAAATTCAGSLMWAALAAFGNRSGWQRHLTLAIATAYLALVVIKIAGFAA